MQRRTINVMVEEIEEILGDEHNEFTYVDVRGEMHPELIFQDKKGDYFKIAYYTDGEVISAMSIKAQQVFPEIVQYTIYR